VIENNSPIIVYTADGQRTVWDIPFQFLAASDILLFLQHDTSYTQINQADYQVNLSTNQLQYPVQALGNDEEVTPLPQGDRLVIMRRTALTQTADSTQSNFKSKNVEQMVDKLTKIVQELTEHLDHCIQYNPIDAIHGETDAGQFLADLYSVINQKQGDLTLLSGFDNTKTQRLIQVNGVMQWVDEA